MNQRHLEFCASAEWADIVETEILPWAVGDLDLGDDVLEVGSGPGLTTDVLRRRVPRLTAVEIDPDLARSLKERLRDSNVQVIRADAARLPLESGRFSAATSFAMLHHVPSRELQDGLLAELCRVLRPGGLLVGSDAVGTGELDEFHRGDTYVPCDPDELPAGSGRPATSTSGWSSASWTSSTAATPTCRATRMSCRAGSGRPATSTYGWSSATWARAVPRRAAGGSASALRRPETREVRGRPAESWPSRRISGVWCRPAARRRIGTTGIRSARAPAAPCDRASGCGRGW